MKPECIQAVRDEIYRLEWLSILDPEKITYVTREEGIQALRDEIFTPEWLESKSVGQLDHLIRDVCIDAIRNGETELNALDRLDEAQLLDGICTGQYPPPERIVLK